MQCPLRQLDIWCVFVLHLRRRPLRALKCGHRNVRISLITLYQILAAHHRMVPNIRHWKHGSFDGFQFAQTPQRKLVLLIVCVFVLCDSDGDRWCCLLLPHASAIHHRCHAFPIYSSLCVVVYTCVISMNTKIVAFSAQISHAC